MPEQANPSRGKLELIQAGRALAALLVVVFHATELGRQKLNYNFLFGLFEFGEAGVDFFFVLSGFIIFFVHRRDMGQRQNIKPFLLKRLIRIYPLYWLITLTLLPVYFAVPSFGHGYERNLGVILKSLLLYPQDHPPILNVAWTLCHEIFFYVVFLGAMWWVPKVFIKVALAWISTTTVLFVANLIQPETVVLSPLPQLILSPYNLEFAFGGITAYCITRYRIGHSLSILLIGVFLFGIAGLVDTYSTFPVNRILAYGVASTLIIWGAASLDIHQPLKVPAIFDRLGDASYSIYLIHYAAFSVILKVLLALNIVNWIGNFMALMLLVVTSLGLGYVVHVGLEKPIIAFLRQKLLSKGPHAINQNSSQSAVVLRREPPDSPSYSERH